MNLQSKTIVITGATAGIGEALARRLAAHGPKLVLTGRRQARLDALKKELKCEVTPLCFDVADQNAVTQALSPIAADILVNNAGLALGLGKAPDISLEDWETMIDTNLKGLLYCTHALLPGMVARDAGHIVNLGSIAGSYPYPGGNVYGATKAFLKQFSLNLRADLLGKQIRVTNIEPGMVETEFSQVRFHGDKHRAADVYKDTVPLTADDIAQSIEWCITLPAHVNINRLEIMPTMQAFAGPVAFRNQ